MGERLTIFEGDLAEAPKHVSARNSESTLSVPNDCESQVTKGLEGVFVEISCEVQKISGKLRKSPEKSGVEAQREDALCVAILSNSVLAVWPVSSSEQSKENLVETEPEDD